MVTVHCILHCTYMFCKMRKRIKKEKTAFWHKAAKLEGGDHENGSRCPLKNILEPPFLQPFSWCTVQCNEIIWNSRMLSRGHLKFSSSPAFCKFDQSNFDWSNIHIIILATILGNSSVQKDTLVIYLRLANAIFISQLHCSKSNT